MDNYYLNHNALLIGPTMSSSKSQTLRSSDTNDDLIRCISDIL